MESSQGHPHCRPYLMSIISQCCFTTHRALGWILLVQRDPHIIQIAVVLQPACSQLFTLDQKIFQALLLDNISPSPHLPTQRVDRDSNFRIQRMTGRESWATPFQISYLDTMNHLQLMVSTADKDTKPITFFFAKSAYSTTLDNNNLLYLNCYR